MTGDTKKFTIWILGMAICLAGSLVVAPSTEASEPAVAGSDRALAEAARPAFVWPFDWPVIAVPWRFSLWQSPGALSSAWAAALERLSANEERCRSRRSERFLSGSCYGFEFDPNG